MRHRIKDYTAYQGIGIINDATGGAYFPIHIVADCGTDLTNFTTRQLIESVLLVFNETTGTLYTSTKKKARIQGVSVQDTTKLNMWFKSTDLDVQPNLEVGGSLFNTPITDDFRIEVDFGESLVDESKAIKDKIDNIDLTPIEGKVDSVSSLVSVESQVIQEKIDAIPAPDLTSVAKESTVLAESQTIQTKIAEIILDANLVDKLTEAVELLEGFDALEIGNLKATYSARFEQNDDGEDTWTMILPIVAGVEEGTLTI